MIKREGYRLSSGGLIDRTKPLDFCFDGESLTGLSGDTLASALIANGIRLVGRSFKYHRPRGILTAGNEEPNALVTLRSRDRAEPNTRATVTQLFQGLDATSQNCWPNLNFDVLAINQCLSPVFVAGFYYKTFMWPAAFWEKLYEPLIRRAAGLGKLSTRPDPDSYDRAHAFCDLLIIGGGPSGLTAAVIAGRAGARVVLAEDDWLLGGRLLSEKHEINGEPASIWLQDTVAELRSLKNVTLLTRTSVFGAYDGDFGAVERVCDHVPTPMSSQPRQRYWKIVAKRSILAAGAIERPLTFGGNDRPGVMMASAVSAYINRYGVAPGERFAIFTSTDSGWRTAEDLLNADIGVSAVIDARPNPPLHLAERVRRAGGMVFTEAVITDIDGVSPHAVRVRDSAGKLYKVPASTVAMAGGWNPAMGIASNLGAKPTWSHAIHSFVLDTPPSGMKIVGAAAGKLSFQEALSDGMTAGVSVATDLGFRAPPAMSLRTSDDPAAVSPLWLVTGSRTKAFVDFQHDVTDLDVAIASREGFVSIEHLKRYTTLGMSTDQGKASQINGQALLAMQTGKQISQLGTILVRSPYTPVSIGALAGQHRGEHFRPTRFTSSHNWAVERGAKFMDAGAWKRAQWFAQPGDGDWLSTVCREVTQTRNGVGVCDVSTLGKIEVHGPDAATLLDRLYINAISTLRVGAIRYGIMLREDGFVMDDGTITRLSENSFFLTTTTVNAVRVMQHIDYSRQVLWPELNVQAVSVTEQWSQYSVAGPRSRELLRGLLPRTDVSNSAVPYMTSSQIDWHGIAGRLYRVSFSGELAYEVAIPASYGDAFIRAIMDAGVQLDVVPYGVEALNVMRIEKGHAAGGELNGETTARDLDLGKMMSTKKDFIGRALSLRPGLIDPERPILVGLRALDGNKRFGAGAHLLACKSTVTAANDQGHVTSVAYSPSVGRWIGLALLRRGESRIGEVMRAYDPVRSADTKVEVCSRIFVDPEGARVRG